MNRTKGRRSGTQNFRVGDTVVGRRCPGVDMNDADVAAAMKGTVDKVTKHKFSTGGNIATVRVNWASGFSGRHQSRMLQLVERGRS